VFNLSIIEPAPRRPLHARGRVASSVTPCRARAPALPWRTPEARGSSRADDRGPRCTKA